MIQIDPNDVKNKESEIYKKIDSLKPDLKKLVKSNKGIPIEGQLEIIAEITNNLKALHPALCWHGVPTYENLERVIQLAWDHLLKDTEKRYGGVYTRKQLTFMANKYIRFRNMPLFINFLFQNNYDNEPEDKKRIQAVILKAFQIRRHWFEYKLPKLLKTVSEIQSFVFTKYGMKPGNYNYIASQLEDSFLPKNLAILLEYGIPSSAISKLKEYIDEETPLEDIQEEIKDLNLEDIGLVRYEINKIINSL